MRQGIVAGALAAIMVAIVSFAVGASPLMKSRSPFESGSSQISLFHQAVIYAKEGSRKLVDGRWNLGQSESKLGIKLSADETKQLMACTGQIVCQTPDIHTEEEDRVGVKVTATAVSVLRPDLLVTARHVLFKGKRAMVSFGSCSFRSYLRKKVAIPVLVEKDQRRGYAFNNEDFVVLRLKRELEDCRAFAINDSDASLREGEQVLSVTGHQLRTLNKVSGREPVVARGKIRRIFDGVLGGPPFYYSDIDFDVGGSGGAVFALRDRRPRFPHADHPHLAPVSDDEGRIILRGISVGYGLRAKNGRPYSEDRNYTIIIGLQAEFRDLVTGKAHKPAAVEPAPCLQGGAAKINVISESVPLAQSETFAPSLRQYACSREATPGRKAGKANANCSKLAKGLKLVASQRAKEKREFTLKNDTSCRICFTYNRCNGYGCWDEAVRLSAESTLSAGVSERAPVINNPQFCK
ncbi:MAG TPA: serine protease [Methyloceanibacter sp.]|nr:serine protease [Methyloceanibacter sp.]